MTRFIKTFGTRFSTAVQRAGHARVRRELLRLSDRALADAGFSRELLECGVRAWPWRTEASTGNAGHVGLVADRQRRAIRELEALNDAELADLALVRSDIPRAVREGRPGIEYDGDFGEGQRIAA